MERRKPDTFTTEEILYFFSRLKELGEGLDKMLLEYQPEKRRNEINELRVFCNPLSILSDFTPCQLWYGVIGDIDEMMRSIRLEKELIQCKRANKLLAYWSGNPKLNIYGEGFHPWIDEEPDLKQYPKGLRYCYESIIYSYYQCMYITSREWAWDFYRKSIFRQAGVRTPLHSSDLEKWEEMQRNYFDSQKLRREFLENLSLAMNRASGDEDDFDDEYEEDQEDECLSLDAEAGSTVAHGFVYFIRNGDLCKIGITENLLRRMDQLKPDEVLNVVRCKNFRELEKDLHSLFKEVRIPQTEYFRLSEEQISKAHKLMTSLADF